MCFPILHMLPPGQSFEVHLVFLIQVANRIQKWEKG